MKTVAMLAHWTAILFLVGAPLAGLIGAIPAALIAGAAGLLVAEVHAGVWDEFMGSLAGPEPVYTWTAHGRKADGTIGSMTQQEYADLTADRGLSDEIRRVLNGEVSQ